MRIPKISAAIFSTLFLRSLCSYACSCGSDLNYQVSRAEKIFLAKAISARVHNDANETSSYAEVEFSVIRQLKGELPKSVTVKTKPPGGDCGIPITIAQTYVVFLRKGDEQIQMCGGTHEMYGFQTKELEEILRAIKKLSK